MPRLRAAAVAPLRLAGYVALERVGEHDAVFAPECAVAFNLVLARDKDGRDGSAEELDAWG